jgi:hypothetical protein
MWDSAVQGKEEEEDERGHTHSRGEERGEREREREKPDPISAGSTRKERDRILDEEAGGGSNQRWGQETLVRERGTKQHTSIVCRQNLKSIRVLVRPLSL